MMDQNTFMEIVQSVAEIVRTAEAPMTEDEILDYFSDMNLDDGQKRMVLNYIATTNSGEKEEISTVEDEGSNANVSDEDAEEERTSQVFRMYLDELATLPTYNVDERVALYDKLLAGDGTVIEELSTAWLKRVLTIAEKYIEPKLNVEDLVQEGNVALFTKLQELLGGGKVDNIEEILSTAVEEGIVQYCSMMTGERELENTLVGKVSLVHEARKMLTLENGQEPTLEELSVYTKMSLEELKEIEELL